MLLVVVARNWAEVVRNFAWGAVGTLAVQVVVDTLAVQAVVDIAVVVARIVLLVQARHNHHRPMIHVFHRPNQ